MAQFMKVSEAILEAVMTGDGGTDCQTDSGCAQ